MSLNGFDSLTSEQADKPYQVRQARNIILRYRFERRE